MSYSLSDVCSQWEGAIFDPPIAPQNLGSDRSKTPNLETPNTVQGPPHMPNMVTVIKGVGGANTQFVTSIISL